MQEHETEKLIQKILERLKQDENLGEKLLFINQIHSSKGSVSVRISKQAYDLAKELCDQTNMTVNAYVTTAVAQRLFEDLKRSDLEG